MKFFTRFLFIACLCCTLPAWAQGDLTPFEKNGKFGYLNSQGSLVIDTVYAFADVFSEGLALVERDGKKSYINEKGEQVIGPGTWLSASFFSDGWAKIKDSTHSYYIDRT